MGLCERLETVISPALFTFVIRTWLNCSAFVFVVSVTASYSVILIRFSNLLSYCFALNSLR
jgi:hypothetical protein